MLVKPPANPALGIVWRVASSLGIAFERRVGDAMVGAMLRAVPSFGCSATPTFDDVAVRWAPAGSTCSCH